MQTNKILVLNILLFLFVGCKKDINAQHTIKTLNTAKVKKIEPLTNEINYLDKIQEKSFVVSCGSGCAMTYTTEQIIKNESSYKVKFKVEMYINEVLSDTYNETYLFVYDNSNKIDKIILEGTQRNALETLPKGAQESFREFSDNLNKPLKENSVGKSIKFSSSILPYQKKINIDKVSYQSMSVNSIKGLSEFSCGEDKIRYIPLDKIEKVNLILIPMDCGDSPYRYYLISIFNNSVASNLYVEGESDEPENNETPEKTSFTIDKNSILTVKTTNKNFENGINKEKKYKITDLGKIVEVK
ncbi:hypothetical protein [Chryseobacterium echinoideorum]|uniref:hypothetical protein n=1 Tax=Chryseobacterium echinoideorum TaxID=1549648 RepID=UPI0011857F0C|nr:hypothetical protein [Chryseobacterium echinoideorum]